MQNIEKFMLWVSNMNDNNVVGKTIDGKGGFLYENCCDGRHLYDVL